METKGFVQQLLMLPPDVRVAKMVKYKKIIFFVLLILAVAMIQGAGNTKVKNKYPPEQLYVEVTINKIKSEGSNNNEIVDWSATIYEYATTEIIAPDNTTVNQRLALGVFSDISTVSNKLTDDELKAELMTIVTDRAKNEFAVEIDEKRPHLKGEKITNG